MTTISRATDEMIEILIKEGKVKDRTDFIKQAIDEKMDRELQRIGKEKSPAKASPHEPTDKVSEEKEAEVSVAHTGGGVKKCPKCQSNKVSGHHDKNVFKGYCSNCETEFDIEDGEVTYDKEVVN